MTKNSTTYSSIHHHPTNNSFITIMILHYLHKQFFHSRPSVFIGNFILHEQGRNPGGQVAMASWVGSSKYISMLDYLEQSHH